MFQALSPWPSMSLPLPPSKQSIGNIEVGVLLGLITIRVSTGEYVNFVFVFLTCTHLELLSPSPLSVMSMPTDMLRHLGYMSNVRVDKQLSILVYIDHQPITMRD